MTREAIHHLLDTNQTVETERLFMRRLIVQDAPALFAIDSDPRVSCYLLWDPHPTLSYTKQYLRNLMRLYVNHKYYEWGVFLKESGTLIGTCGITAFNYLANSAEIGYSFGVPYWGNGYATEAVGATLKYGFELLRLSNMKACYAMVNRASAAVLHKNGMSFLEEGERMIIKGVEHEIGISCITQEAYHQIHHPETIPIS